MIKRHTQMRVWQSAMTLAEEIYKFSATLPDSEKFGLQSQMQRCVVSIPSNITEGAARHSDREFLRFLNIAKGSLAELETQMLLCQRLFNLNWDFDKSFNLIEQVFAQNESLRTTVLKSIEH